MTIESTGSLRLPANRIFTHHKPTTNPLTQPDVLFCFDLELPQGFAPVAVDGEVADFSLVPVSDLVDMLRDPNRYDEWKPNVRDLGR